MQQGTNVNANLDYLFYLSDELSYRANDFQKWRDNLRQYITNEIHSQWNDDQYEEFKFGFDSMVSANIDELNEKIREFSAYVSGKAEVLQQYLEKRIQ